MFYGLEIYLFLALNALLPASAGKSGEFFSFYPPEVKDIS